MINPLIVAAAPNSGLARRRKIDFADLADTPWLLPADTWTYALLAEAFRERRLAAPKVRLVTCPYKFAPTCLPTANVSRCFQLR